MIRGINKRVIEINDIGSEYFEKALLIVKDNKATVPNLEREADRVMQAYFPKRVEVGGIGYLRKKSLKRKKRMFAVGLTVLVLGLVVTAVLISLNI